MGMFSIDENIEGYFSGKKIYRIWNTEHVGYDCYCGAIVVAEDEDSARYIHPGTMKTNWWEDRRAFSDWTHPDKVGVEFIGYVDNNEYNCGDVIMYQYSAG